MHTDGGESWRRTDLGNYSLTQVLPAQKSEFCFQLAPLRLSASVISLQEKHSALCPLSSTITLQNRLKCSCYPLRQWCDMMCLLVPVLAASCSHLAAVRVTEGGSSKENEAAAHWHTLLVFPEANCRNSCTCNPPVSVETLKTEEGRTCRIQVRKTFL